MTVDTAPGICGYTPLQVWQREDSNNVIVTNCGSQTSSTVRPAN